VTPPTAVQKPTPPAWTSTGERPDPGGEADARSEELEGDERQARDEQQVGDPAAQQRVLKPRAKPQPGEHDVLVGLAAPRPPRPHDARRGEMDRARAGRHGPAVEGDDHLADRRAHPVGHPGGARRGGAEAGRGERPGARAVTAP